MKKTLITTMIAGLLCCTLAGCNFFGFSSSSSDSSSNDVKAKQETVQNNPSTYKYSSNSTFKVISVETIDDGTMNGQVIYTMVNRQTKVMYAMVEKYKGGYGLTSQELHDKDGKPLIYTGSLD